MLSSLKVEDQSLQDNTNLEFTSEEALCILKLAVSAFYVSITLQKMSKTADFCSKNIFFISFIAMLEGWCNSQQGEVDSSKIDSLLMSWNLKRVVVPGDGNCLFTSVAFSLVQRAQKGDTVNSGV